MSKALPVSTVTVLPVKGKGSAVHYVRRSGKLGLEASVSSLCGKLGPLDSYARPKWRRVRTAKSVCQVCHMMACAVNARVDWS